MVWFVAAVALVLSSSRVARADAPKAFLDELCRSLRKRDVRYLKQHMRLPVRVTTRVDDDIEQGPKARRKSLTTMRQVLAHRFLCDVDPARIDVSSPAKDTWAFEVEIGQFTERMTVDRVATSPRLISYEN